MWLAITNLNLRNYGFVTIHKFPLRGVQLVDKLFKRLDEVLNQLKLVVIHFGRQVQIGFPWTDAV